MQHKITLRGSYKIIKKKEKGKSVNFLPALSIIIIMIKPTQELANGVLFFSNFFLFFFVCVHKLFSRGIRLFWFYRLKLKDKGGKRTNNARIYILQSPQLCIIIFHQSRYDEVSIICNSRTDGVCIGTNEINLLIFDFCI